jgi:hypothetical protein
MITEIYDKVRKSLFGGHHQNVFLPLIGERAAISGPLQGTPEEFSQILYELTEGELDKQNGTVSYAVMAGKKTDTLKFCDGNLFRVVRAKGLLGEALIVVTPHLQSMDELLDARELPLAFLVSDTLAVREAYKRVANEYRREQLKAAAEKAGAEIRMTRESRLDAVLETIERSKSGETIMVRGVQNIDALVDLGFAPCLVDNPDAWIDAEDMPGLRYRHSGSGVEVLLTGRERFRPIEETGRLEFVFLVNRSDDDPAAYKRMVRKYREARKDGTPYAQKELHADLMALVKYPEELKGRTEEDLGLMADEVEHVIDLRQELDKGILPYEAVFRRDTLTILDHIRKNRTPAPEIRKALDYFEYTGMIDQRYKEALNRQIEAAAQMPARVVQVSDQLLYDKRVKEIVAEVLQKIPKERLTERAITLALTPYVGTLGFGRLVKIRERILQLKTMVRDQQGVPN